MFYEVPLDNRIIWHNRGIEDMEQKKSGKGGRLLSFFPAEVNTFFFVGNMWNAQLFCASYNLLFIRSFFSEALNDV